MRARHVVGNHRGGNAIFHQLPRRQSRTLQERTRLIGKDMDFLSLLDGGADHSQRRAISAGGQGPGIAVGENAAAGRHQGRAVPAHGLVGGDVFGMHALGFFNQRLLDLRQRPHPQHLKLVPHALDRPEKIYRCRPGLPDHIADLIELVLQIAAILSFRSLHPERDTHRRSHANGRRAPHHHVADDIGDLGVSLAGNVSLFGRQLRLINEAHAGIGPFESLNHRGSRQSFGRQSSANSSRL